MRYLILEGQSIDDGSDGATGLEDEVNRYLALGWRLVGGLCVVREERFGKFSGEPSTRFFQAVSWAGDNVPLPE